MQPRFLRRTGIESAGMESAGMESASMKPGGGIMMAGAAVLLALAGCGHEAYEDSYPATSSVIVDGGTGVTASAMDDQPAGQTGEVTAGPAAGQSGTILFMASPGNGLPPQVIARTDSITSVPTPEFLAREALASQRQGETRRQAPAGGSRMTAPLVVTADQDRTSPIILPAAPATPLAGSSPAGTSPNGSLPANSRIRISRQTGVDDGPTILKIIVAP